MMQFITLYKYESEDEPRLFSLVVTAESRDHAFRLIQEDIKSTDVVLLGMSEGQWVGEVAAEVHRHGLVRKVDKVAPTPWQLTQEAWQA